MRFVCQINLTHFDAPNSPKQPNPLIIKCVRRFQHKSPFPTLLRQQNQNDPI